jgi:hypothetical protein
VELVSVTELNKLFDRQEWEIDQLTVKHSTELREIAIREGRLPAARLYMMKINALRDRWTGRGRPLDQSWSDSQEPNEN